MIAISNSLIELLHSQQQIQNDTTYTFTAIQQAHLELANDSLIDNIPTFDRNEKHILNGFSN